LALAVPLPDEASLEQGACLGIPGITAHRAVHVAGPVRGLTVLVQGGTGAVGACAVQLARRAGARVIATVRNAGDEAAARRAGADEVISGKEDVAARVLALAPGGVDHIVEVALAANAAMDVEMLKPGGSIAAYASDAAATSVPFWPLVFKNARLFFLGSDDFPPEAKAAAARDLNDALAAGWAGPDIAARFPLDAIALAHERVEQPVRPGRVIVTLP
jgi:NADPH2:quinone reductase